MAQRKRAWSILPLLILAAVLASTLPIAVLAQPNDQVLQAPEAIVTDQAAEGERLPESTDAPLDEARASEEEEGLYSAEEPIVLEEDASDLIPAERSSEELAPEDDPILVPATSPSGNPEDYPANALGFYQWMGDADAVAVFSERVYKDQKDGNPDYTQCVQDYTDMGAEDDATSLDNMKRALELIFEGNQLRTTDEHFAGLASLKVTSYLMAIAQLHCNWEAQEYNHVRAYDVGENLHCTTQDPYIGWYHDEKELFENAGNQWVSGTGHYKNLVYSPYKGTGLAVTPSELGNWNPGQYEPYTYTQVFGTDSSSSHRAYTIDEYYDLFMQFYNAVSEPRSISSAKVTLSPSDPIYDGTPKEPSVEVKVNGRLLVEGIDYSVSFFNNVQPGTATARITGIGVFTGFVDKSFTIKGIPFTSAVVTLDQESYIYDGTAKKPNPTVVFEGSTLVQGTDYTVSYYNNTNAGTASVRISGRGIYGDGPRKPFTISPYPLDTTNVTLGATSFAYDGNPKEPIPTVRVSGRLLSLNAHYQVSYTNNVEVGTATATITGIGNYTGSVEMEFEIRSGISISGCTISRQTQYYNGTVQAPDLTLKYGSTTLVEGVDYTLSYPSAVNAGTYDVAITGIGDYAGSRQTYFTIYRPNLNYASVTLDPPFCYYDGAPKEPVPTIMLYGRTLIEGTDYTLSYSDNVEIGTATLAITGIGNYMGSKNLSFEISTGIPVSTCELSMLPSYYNGTAQAPDLTLKYGSTTLVEGVDYTLSYPSAVNAGTYDVAITGIGDYAGSRQTSFTIYPENLSMVHFNVNPTSFIYDGTAKRPSITVFAYGELVEGVDYDVSCPDAIEVGSYTLTITGKGNFTGTRNKTFEITSGIPISSCQVTNKMVPYNGAPRTPDLQIKDGSKTLVEGVDYTISYPVAIEPGHYNCTITGIGAYSGSRSHLMVITYTPINRATVTLSPTSFTYDGNAKQPLLTLAFDGRTLEEGTDYTYSFSNNTNAGTATITINGQGYFRDSTSKTFYISRANVASAELTLDQSSFVFDGAAKTPAPTVTLGGRTLEEGTDYTLSYTNNVNAGTATVKVTGKGNYTGTKQATFTIAPASVSSATVSAIPDQAYDGNAKTPTPTVTYGGRTLVKGTDYTLSYSGNTNAGTATVTITGQGNYSGTKQVTFKINPASISSATVTDIVSKTYTGSAQTQSPAVKVGGRTLEEGTDYTLGYTNNINAGTATMTITGKGNYAGTKNATFTISPASISSATVTGIVSKTYTGSAQTQSPTVKVGSQALVIGTDYTMSYSDNINVGTATITLTGQGNYSGTRQVTFTISPASISSATVTAIPDQAYDGNAKTPTPTVKVGGRTLEEGTDYTLGYSNNVNAGTATVKVTGQGNYSGTKQVTFTIGPASIADATVSAIPDQAHDGKAKTPEPMVEYGSTTLVKGADYTLSYSNNTNVGTATVTITGKGNYSGSVNKTFKITENAPTYTPISACTIGQIPAQAYDGNAKTPAPTVKYGSTTLVKGTDYTLSYSNNVNAGTATVTITGQGNYTGTKQVTFTISPASISSATVTGIASKTYTGSAQTQSPTVKVGSRTLVKDTDYTLGYTNNINAGTATVTITGKGNFTGTLQATFTIKPASISDATVSAIPEQVYDGKAKTPEPTVRANGQTLRKGTDYTLSYSNNINAGTATVTITGKGNYTGSVNRTFTIAAAEPAPQEEVAVYRMYNWRTSEHLYTTSAGEYRACGSGAYRDWVQEGVAWYAPKQGKPVYRLYNLRSGDHHYTTSAGERDSLVANHGWRYETVAFYSGGDVSILRVYNGRLKRGQHHYTTSAGERDSLVANHGWRDEGVGFYGIRVGKTESFRMVPAGTYRGTAPDTGARWTLTVRSDGSYSLGISSAPGTVSEGDVVIKARYALDPGDPRNPPVVRPAGPYDFYLRRSEGPDLYMCFRYDPTTDGGCVWASHLDSGSEWKLVRS